MKTSYQACAGLAAAAATALSMPAWAEEFVDRARIVQVTPVVETVRAKGYGSGGCEVEQVYSYREDRTGQKIIGGLLGGVAGSRIGGGSGRDAAAATGAVLGSELGGQDGGLTGEELIGALLGGAAGSAIGKGSGRTAAIAAGALAGSMFANELTRPAGRTRQYSRQECRPGTTLRKAITGYEVTFDYGGVLSTSVLPYQPDGDYVDVNVNVELLEDRTVGYGR